MLIADPGMYVGGEHMEIFPLSHLSDRPISHRTLLETNQVISLINRACIDEPTDNLVESSECDQKISVIINSGRYQIVIEIDQYPG
jgi:hypothetical protein